MPDHDHEHDAAGALALMKGATADLVPSPDLERRLAERLASSARRQRRHRGLVAVAAVVALVAGAVGVATLASDEDRGEPTVAGPPDSTAPPTESVPPSPTDLDRATTGHWEEIATAPFALGRREAAATATSDRYVLTWGGRIDGENEALADGAVLDLTTGEWHRIDAAPGIDGRWGATAAIDGDVAWIVGGTVADPTDDDLAGNDGGGDGEVLRIDLATGDTSGAATDERAARIEPAVAVHDGEVVVAGGRIGGEEARGVAALDPASGTWRDGADLPWSTASSDYSAQILDTAVASISGDAMAIARRAGSSDDVRIDVAWLDLASLTTSAPVVVRLGSGEFVLDEVAIVAGDRTIVLYDRPSADYDLPSAADFEDSIQAVGLDGAAVTWTRTLSIGSCEGPVRGQAVGTIAIVELCGRSTLVDPMDGRAAPVPPPPTEDGTGVTVVAGNRVLTVATDGGGALTAWVLVAG